MYGPATCGSTGGPWCNYVWRNDNYKAPATPITPAKKVVN